MNQDPERTPYEVGDLYKEDKRSFSRIGFAMLSYIALTFLLSEAYSYLAGQYFLELAQTEIMYWVAHCLICYVFSMPVAILILRSGVKASAPMPSRKLSAGEFLAIIPCAYAIMYIGNYIGSYINAFLSMITGGATSSSGLTNLLLDMSPIGTFLVVVVIGPFMEELLFRKYLIGSLRPWGEKTAIWVSALFFGLIHGNLEQFFYAFLIGAGLGFVYLKTGKMRYNVALHMIINFIGGFLPTLIMKYAMDIEALEAALEQFMTSTSGYEDIKNFFVSFFTDFQPGVSLYCALLILNLGLDIAGFVILVNQRKKIRYSPGERTIDRSYYGETVFMAPGILIAIIAALASIVYNMYAMYNA